VNTLQTGKSSSREGDKPASDGIGVIKTAVNGPKSCAFTEAVCKYIHYISRKTQWQFGFRQLNDLSVNQIIYKVGERPFIN